MTASQFANTTCNGCWYYAPMLKGVRSVAVTFHVVALFLSFTSTVLGLTLRTVPVMVPDLVSKLTISPTNNLRVTLRAMYVRWLLTAATTRLSSALSMRWI
jgi:hypothetical protein